MTDDDHKYQHFAQAISPERFARYQAFAKGDDAEAYQLYSINLRLSEAFYPSLHGLELALRNQIHNRLTEMFDERWFNREEFQRLDSQKEQLAEVYERLRKDPEHCAPGQVVAGLMLGYWTALLSREYDDVWQTGLNTIAVNASGKRFARKQIHEPLTNIRNLRNRIAHHEPIITWDLGKRHEWSIDLTRWLSPSVADWVSENDRFPVLYEPLKAPNLLVREEEKARRAEAKVAKAVKE